jgi:tetratricopeptide (TPR) repeat protein
MKIIMTFLIIFFTSDLIFSQANSNFDAEGTYSKALEYYNSSNFDEAIKLFKQLIDKNYKNKYVYISLLNSYVARLRNFNYIKDQKEYIEILMEATRFAKTAFEMYPDDKQIIYNYLMLLDERMDYKSMDKPLKKLIEIDKNDLLANFYLGVIEYSKRNYKNAEDYFKVVVESKNISTELDFFIVYKSLFNLGQLELEKQNFFQAIGYFERAASLYRNDYRLIVNLAICYAEVLDFEKAINLMDKIPQFLWSDGLYEIYAGLLFITKDNRFEEFTEKYKAETPYIKALALYNSKKYEDALALLKDYTKNNPAPHFFIHYLFFRIYDSTKNFEMANKEALLLGEKAEISRKIDIAIEFYTYIEKNKGGIPLIYWVIGNLYEEKKDYTNSIKYYEKYISFDNKSEIKENLIAAYLKLAYVNYQTGKKEKSKYYLKKAEENVKNNDELYYVYFYKGLMMFDEKAYDRAIDFFKKALELSKNEAKLYFFIGASFFEKDDRMSAIEYLEKAFSIEPSDPEINNLLAYSYALEKKNFDRAMELVESALTVKPENIAYLDTKGWIYYQRGEYEKAFEVFNRVETLIQKTNEGTAGFDEIYFHLAKIYEEMGNEKEARNYKEKIRKYFPKSKWKDKR